MTFFPQSFVARWQRIQTSNRREVVGSTPVRSSRFFPEFPGVVIRQTLVQALTGRQCFVVCW